MKELKKMLKGLTVAEKLYILAIEKRKQQAKHE